MAQASVRFELGEWEWVDERDSAIETFIEFEADIHRIALREFVSRLGGEPPILLTAADVAA